MGALGGANSCSREPSNDHAVLSARSLLQNHPPALQIALLRNSICARWENSWSRWLLRCEERRREDKFCKVTAMPPHQNNCSCAGYQARRGKNSAKLPQKPWPVTETESSPSAVQPGPGRIQGKLLPFQKRQSWEMLVGPGALHPREQLPLSLKFMAALFRA